jgi:hypothetical protein
VAPSWLALCWIALGSGFESQRRYLFFMNITTGGDITGGFFPGLVSPPATSWYRISEDNLRGTACVSKWMLISVKKDGGLAFHNLNGCIRTINLNK